MYNTILNRIRSVLYVFSVTAMSVMLVIIFAQVITRYFFHYTPEWSEEVARFLFVWVVFLGSALILGESGHLAVQFLPDLLKETIWGKVLKIIVNLAGYIFIGILLSQGFLMTKTMTFQLSPGMDLPMSYVYSVIPISAVLMLLYMVKDTMNIVADLRGNTNDENTENNISKQKKSDGRGK